MLHLKLTHVRSSEIGVNGVCLVGTASTEQPTSNQVMDNYFQHTGAILTYSAAVFLGLSDDNLIAHNAIQDVPHHGICLGSNISGRNRVEFNELRRTCMQSQDNGAINIWMDQAPEGSLPRGHVIRCNYIADTRGCWQHANETLTAGVETSGIYLDNRSSNCQIFGNIIVRGGIGIDPHGGSKNSMENNIIDECNLGMYAHSSWPSYYVDNSFCRNIVSVTSKGNTGPWKKGYLFTIAQYNCNGKLFAKSDNNVFYNPVDGCNFFSSGEDPMLQKAAESPDRGVAFELWQKLGYDSHSVMGDPLFVDTEHDDYRLRPESPALKLGFQPTDVSRIRVRKSKSEQMDTVKIKERKK